MALAIEAKRLIEGGVVADAAEMARIAGMTRARMTQILNLTLLAPDIQEQLLGLVRGEDMGRHLVARVARELLWSDQRRQLRQK